MQKYKSRAVCATFVLTFLRAGVFSKVEIEKMKNMIAVPEVVRAVAIGSVAYAAIAMLFTALSSSFLRFLNRRFPT
jgi:hypothetical protein